MVPPQAGWEHVEPPKPGGQAQAVPGLRATIQLLPTDVEAHFDDPKDTA